jgi:Outer membrane protein beta-barrel domain
MNRFFTLLIFLCVFTQLSNAQEMGYGIRVGINFNKLNAPSEMDADGNVLETHDFNTGFHVGGAIIFKFTDLFGLKTEFLFSQKGMKYKYEGPSFQFFTEELSGNQVKSTGDRLYRMTVTNSYIEFPITAYYKFGERFEVHGGFLVGFLAGSTAVGEFDYKGAFPVGNDDINFIQNLEFNYRKDQPASPDDITNDTEVIEFLSQNDLVRFPKTVGAYYMDYPEKSGNFYNTFDFGLTGGFSFFINGGLFLMFSGNYGLVDITNNFYDISRLESDGLNYIKRNDKDYNVSLQGSIGFSF